MRQQTGRKTKLLSDSLVSIDDDYKLLVYPIEMHGLSLPNRPKQPLPPLASSSSSPPLTNDAPSSSSSLHSLFRPKPPPNFAQQQRTRARQLRGEKKSPFVPKKTQQSDGQLRGTPTSGTGKERDLTSCSIEQLQDMLEKNQRLLDSP